MENKKSPQEEIQKGGKKVLLSWQAPEYPYYEKNTSWFLAFSVILIGLVVFAFVSRSWLTAIAFILAGFVLLMLQRRKPENIDHEISTSSFRVGEKNYPFSKLKSFWIVETKEGNTLHLEPGRRFHLPLVFQLGDLETKKVREILGKYLPEKAKG